MFLGAKNVCISPRTVFGFHGPSVYGRPLSPKQFDYWSKVMSKHYPAQLRRKFMQDWRYRINGYVSIKGVQLIGLGYKPC